MGGFLHPWFWLGALAVAAPLWLHLRERTETNLLRFSALQFLDDQPLPRRRARRPRELLLLALRMLAVLLLVAAFSQPYRRTAELLPVKESRVYVLDNTLSHQADNGLGRERDRLVSELARLGDDIQVAVVELTAQPRVLAGFGDDRRMAAQRLKQLQASYQRGSYLAAFRQATALLGNSLGARKRILFRGDNQENQWTENQTTPAFLHDVEVDLPRTRTLQRPNLALAEARAQRLFLGDKSLVHFTVALTHQGAAERADASLRVNGETIFTGTVDLSRQPETVLLQRQWEADPGVWLRGEVTIEGQPDALPGDNRVFFSVPPVREGRVALLAQSPYLRLGLSPEVVRGHWATRFLDPGNLASELASNDDAEVLCLESLYLQSAEVRRLLARYLANRRGVLMFVNRLTPVVTGVLREMGFEATPAPARRAREKFQYVFYNHPVFHPFLSTDYGNLLEVTITSPHRLRALQGMPLVFAESGDAVFYQGTRAAGKLFVAAFGLEADQTSWPLHVSFIPFLDLCLQNARPEDLMPSNYEPGEAAVVRPPADAAVREVVLRAGPREVQRVPVVSGQARLLMPAQPGLYELSYDARPEPERVLSVNGSPKESRLSYLEAPTTVGLWQLKSGGAPAGGVELARLAPVTAASIQTQLQWWWLLVAGLAALAGEATWTALRRRTT